MALNLGTTAISALKLGSADVSKLMLGDVQVWPVGGNLWTPADLPGLVSWIDLGDPATITLNGDRVVEIANKAAGGRKIVAADANNQFWHVANAQNGLSAVENQNDGVDRQMVFEAEEVAHTAYWMAGKFTDTTKERPSLADGPNYWYHAYGAPRTGVLDLANINGGIAGNAGARDRGAVVDRVAVAKHSRQSGLSSSEPTFFAFFSSQAVGTTGFTPSWNANYSTVGIRYEFILGSQVPSTEDADRMDGYLAHRWGMASYLPADHPYKSAPPTKPTP